MPSSDKSPNLGSVELAITYSCNNRCPNCVTQCAQAPATLHITPDMLGKFIDDCNESCFFPGHISIHGGEPVMNPDIVELMKMLMAWRAEVKPSMILWLLTNDSCTEIREAVAEIEALGIPIGRATKEGANQVDGVWIPYIPVNVSPTDQDLPYELGCFQSWDCGVCYNYAGWFPCSSAGSMHRLFDWAKPICTSAKDLTVERIRASYPTFCKHCGFARDKMSKECRVVRQTTTPTWQKAFDQYRAAHP